MSNFLEFVNKKKAKESVKKPEKEGEISIKDILSSLDGKSFGNISDEKLKKLEKKRKRKRSEDTEDSSDENLLDLNEKLHQELGNTNDPIEDIEDTYNKNTTKEKVLNENLKKKEKPLKHETIYEIKSFSKEAKEKDIIKFFEKYLQVKSIKMLNNKHGEFSGKIFLKTNDSTETDLLSQKITYDNVVLKIKKQK